MLFPNSQSLVKPMSIPQDNTRRHDGFNLGTHFESRIRHARFTSKNCSMVASSSVDMVITSRLNQCTKPFPLCASTTLWRSRIPTGKYSSSPHRQCRATLTWLSTSASGKLRAERLRDVHHAPQRTLALHQSSISGYAALPDHQLPPGICFPWKTYWGLCIPTTNNR